MLNINQIYNEDCLSGMKKLPDGSIDFIFSDLPYGITNNSWDTQKSKIHSTQKPIAACEYFIRTYTNPGDIVLDPCAGSATTAVSAINTNRNFICFEKDKEIYSKAKERILKAQNKI